MSTAWNARATRTSKWIRRERRLRLYTRDRWRCAYCRIPVVLARGYKNTATLDHIVPRCVGGTHASENLVTACVRCNSKKQHRAKARTSTSR